MNTNKARCSALILAPSFKTSDYLGIIRSLAPEIDQSRPGRLEAARLPALRTVIRLGSQKTSGMLNFDEIASLDAAEHAKELTRLASVLQFDDPINIQFTSGTTGSPKGATLTHHNILNSLRRSYERCGPEDGR